jgi:Mrp family chromosome partitioning ATPase
MKSIIISADYAEDIQASSQDHPHGASADLVTQAPVRDDEMISLFRALQVGMPQKAHWTLGVISTSSGEGVSSIARGLARIVARTPGARVLICDVAGNPRGRSEPSNSRALATRSSYSDDMNRIEFSWLPGSNQIAVGSFGEPGQMHAIASDVETVRAMVSTVSAGFELVILDLPPVSESVVGPALAKAVDGVVLVVEAERTRSQSVRATHKTLQMYGGNVLGVVLNKRRFHIPEVVYRRL